MVYLPLAYEAFVPLLSLLSDEYTSQARVFLAWVCYLIQTVTHPAYDHTVDLGLYQVRMLSLMQHMVYLHLVTRDISLAYLATLPGLLPSPRLHLGVCFRHLSP
jgi:hypothetical protein